MKLCKGCKSRPFCRELCDDARAYIEQDHTSRSEEIVESLFIIDEAFKNVFDVDVDRDEVNLLVRLYWTEKKTPSEITKVTPFTRGKIIAFVSAFQSLIESTLVKNHQSSLIRVIIRKYFFERLNVRQISKDLGLGYHHVASYIRRFIKNVEKLDMNKCLIEAFLKGASDCLPTKKRHKNKEKANEPV